MVNQNRTVDDINNSEAPAQSSFLYNGRLAIEEWVYLPLEKRQRPGYVKPDVPYYHVAVQPLSYKIEDGGAEGDNLEHTYVAMKTAQGELTPKGSARDELVQAFTKLGYARNTVKDLTEHNAVGKVFRFKRYNRMYNRKAGEEPIRGELMNTPIDTLPDDWAPAPGSEVPVYARAFRGDRAATAAPVQSGGVVKPIGVSIDSVAEAIKTAGIALTEKSVKDFVLDRPDFAVGEILDLALKNQLLSEMQARELISA